MERTIMQDLIRWKSKSHRKPAILWGARQTGKTWLMKEFGKNEFANTVYISFYNNKRIADIFERDYDIHRIINALEVELHVTINIEDSLLIFDEVQNAPRVVESLKYFCEDMPELAVITAGSLLGVSIHEGVSFPVGKVDEFHLHPMSFSEFLLAMGEAKLEGYIQDPSSELIRDFSEHYRELMKEYYCIGGMPEVVSRYIENRDIDEVREIQLAILSQYEGDFGKHVSANELPRIRMVWNSLPVQLAKENKKFFFGHIKKGARRSEYEIALQWLRDSGLIHMVSQVTKPSMPLKSYVDPNSFKIYLLDVGILGALSELDINSVLHGSDIFVEFKGALTEQYVLQEMIASGRTPYYYSGEKSTYEVDFLLQQGSDIIPIEVKSEDNLRSKSLRYFCDKYHPAKAIRFSAADYRDQDWMVNLPLWTVEGIGNALKTAEKQTPDNF